MGNVKNINYDKKEIGVDELPKADRYFIRYVRGDDECPEITMEGDRLVNGLKDGSISTEGLFVRPFSLPFANTLGSRRAA